MVCTSTVIIIFKPSTSCLIAAYSTGKGWQSGMTSLVFLTVSNPAALENSNTSPLGTVLFLTASTVSPFETFTTAVAIAFRKLVCLCVILTIQILFPGVSFILKNFFSPDRQFSFDPFHRFFAGINGCFSVSG